MPSRTITLHPEAWSEVDELARRSYVTRATELGVVLRVGDTGLRKRDFLLVLDETANPIEPWEDALRGLLAMDQ